MFFSLHCVINSNTKFSRAKIESCSQNSRLFQGRTRTSVWIGDQIQFFVDGNTNLYCVMPKTTQSLRDGYINIGLCVLKVITEVKSSVLSNVTRVSFTFLFYRDNSRLMLSFIFMASAVECSRKHHYIQFNKDVILWSSGFNSWF